MISADIHLSFDVGHSSIGWAVLQRATKDGEHPNILGTGVVTFGADDCLAIKRRQYRQQRRHARATRQRIGHIENLLAYLGVMTPEQLAKRHDQAGGDSFAWQKAANILAAAREGQSLPKTSWDELWDILRWYAHNRGYFAPPWANRGDDTLADDDEVPDTEKVAQANAVMVDLGTKTMAETIAAYSLRYEQHAAEWHQGKRDAKPTHFKGLKAAFLRESVVWPEVRTILTALKGKLPKLDDALIRSLLGNDVDPMKDPAAWQTIPCSKIKLPKRYQGGLLFGQSIPRFDNRIIGVCPIQFAKRQAELVAAGFSAKDAKLEAAKQAKLPSKSSPEFLRFCWAMQLANVFGAAPGERETGPLTAEQRKQITQLAEQQGALTKTDFKRAVREAAAWSEKGSRDNLDNLLLHPDAEKALILDPAQRAITKSELSAALVALPNRYRKRLHGKLADGKPVKLAEVRDWLTGADADAFDAEVQRVLDAANTRKGKKQVAKTREDLLAEKLTAEYPKGRAPYARPVLRLAYEEALKGWDPRAEKTDRQPRGCLCQTDELKEAQLQRRLEEQTNNHLVRHRLLILERLFQDLTAAPEFANGDKSRIGGMTIEVNRELRDLSGKTRKEQEQDLGIRLGDFKRVAAKVEEACKRRGILVTAGIIRKARVSEDLGWECPYTGKMFNMDTLLDGVMDKEHIIPHSDRQSDSLDSLAITWKEVNLWKGKRTAMEFIRAEGGRSVPGLKEVYVMSLAEYQKHVASLDTRKGHDDDRARKKRRVRRLLTEHYEEKEFTPRDLTVTSHLVRLGAQVLQRAFPPEHRPPVVSLPGSVTGEVRKAWRLVGCLGAANPAIFEADGKTPKRKDDIRGITHLHHALDACVLGITALAFPKHGDLWTAMLQRRPKPEQRALLKATGYYQFEADGKPRLKPLAQPVVDQIRQRLAERRVVQHIPADMGGVKIEENTRRVLKITEDGRVGLRQQAPRDAKTGLRPEAKDTEEAAGKLLGLNPPNGSGKLKHQKGVRVITDNFGVAILDHTVEGQEKFVVIPWHRVWHRVADLKERNSGRLPRLLRLGCLVRVPNKSGRSDYRGLWMIRGAQINQKQGVLVDLSAPDTITYRVPGRPDCKQNVRLQSLLDGGLEVVKTGYCGIPYASP